MCAEKLQSDEVNSSEKELSLLMELWKSIDSDISTLSSGLNGASIITIIITFVTVIFSVDGSELQITLSIFIYLFIISVALGIFSFFLRKEAYLRGYMAGVEDIIGSIIGKNILIKHKGYEELYKSPYFITNNTLCPMIALLASPLVVLAIGYLFYNCVSNISILIISIIYVVVFAISALVFVFELATNGRAKDRARAYFHLMYNHEVFVPDYKNRKYFRIFNFKLIPELKAVLTKDILNEAWAKKFENK